MFPRNRVLFQQVVDCHNLACKSLLLLVATACCTAFAATDSRPGSPSIVVNRTVPKVSPPKPGLEFSPNPTTQEIFRAHVFEEPLVPVGGEPTPDENAALAVALRGYAKRSGPDDFSSLTGFLESHPRSAWRAALFTDLGLEYYHTAHYSLALEAWLQAWALSKDASGPRERALGDRAFGELLVMTARLGRMEEMTALLKSIEQRPVTGTASERVAGAREALWGMQNLPGLSFRCGPLALRSILIAQHLSDGSNAEIVKSASTQKGCSLPQVADLSRQVGLNYQMAFRERQGDFILPAVVHWKVGHYAALLKKAGNLYQLKDPTFGNETWATKEALEAETTGYFLVPPGVLPSGWRKVEEQEAAGVWGKGSTTFNDPRAFTPLDLKTSDKNCTGMAVPSIHLMLANLNLSDQPLGYTPPVGPAVRFVMRYNQRDSFQPGNFNYSNFGNKWTCDWISYITDNPSNLLADVTQYVGGGGVRTYTGFDPGPQTFAPQQYDQTLLKRTSSGSYELLARDGSRLVFAQPDGSVGTTRKVFLTQMVDPAGNAVTLTYDNNLRLVALADAIGQVTTVTYMSDNPDDGSYYYIVTRVTDPFGRSADLAYHIVISKTVPFIRLTNITDVIGLTSKFGYHDIVNQQEVVFTSFINELITPYGTNIFRSDDDGLGQTGNNRFVEILYPDGSRERVEYTQTNSLQVMSESPSTVAAGMLTLNDYLQFRNTYYWDRNACATAYRDYSKARLFHWMHNDLVTTAGALESMKQPLEGRVYYDYPGQRISPTVIGLSTQPAHVGRVLDDGSTQLYTYEYNAFGHVTRAIDPVGRTFSFFYDSNGIDLLELRQTRSANELLFKATYNAQHRPLTVTDVAGQTTAYTYNARGQILTVTNPKNETSAFAYDTNGYLLAIDGPLPGTNDVIAFSYDPFGRVRTRTNVSGYTVTLDYDALDRVTRLTFPDATFDEFSYDRLDLSVVQDRAERQTRFEYDSMRQLSRRTDPPGRLTQLGWCGCGELSSFTDPMGRATTWQRDVQGRLTSKQYADGSQAAYHYENASGRLREFIDDKHQFCQLAYNRDGTLQSVTYPNAAVTTPSVTYTYDPDYRRISSMSDGIGTSTYTYIPITSPPVLGAGRLAGVDGPLSSDTIAYAYDALGRRTQTAIGGVVQARTFDAAGRVIAETNALGSFAYTYDGASARLTGQTFPNGQTASWSYLDNAHDDALHQITYTVGAALLSQFTYNRDTATGRITTWSQQMGAQPPTLFTFSYDAADQLLSATVTNSGALINRFDYTYDAAGNRLTEVAGGSVSTAAYNALNQLSTRANAAVISRTNEWDAQNRLTAVNAGSDRTEFGYDGSDRLAYLRELQNGSELSFRRLLWCNGSICEERDKSGAVVNKRYFAGGVKVETGTNAGVYFYARDHLGSISAWTDAGGQVRARYAYDPFGRRTKVSGHLDTDFGFADMFVSPQANLSFAAFRAYDADLGRWLSRDPLPNAEMAQGANLYTYVANEPVNRVDPLGFAGSTLGPSGYFGPVPMAPWNPYGNYGNIPANQPLAIRPDAALLLVPLPPANAPRSPDNSLLPDLIQLTLDTIQKITQCAGNTLTLLEATQDTPRPGMANKYYGWIDVEDFSFDIEQTLTIGSGSSGAGVGKITFDSFDSF